MKKLNPFVSRVLILLAPLGEVTVRSMFGGCGIFLDGAMFALISPRDELYFKADEVNRPAFTQQELPSYGKMPYYQAPANALKSFKAIEPWARGAIGASARAKSKKPSKMTKGRR